MKAYLTAHAADLGAMARTLFLTFGLSAMAVVVTFPDVLNTPAGDWKVALTAGCMAVVKLAYNAIDAGYTRYGVGAMASGSKAA